MIITRQARTGVAIAFLLVALQIQGCATGLSDHQGYEANARSAERIDDIRQFIAACESAEMVAIYYGPATSRLRDPLKQIPRQARLSDYECASTEAMNRLLREIGPAM